MKVSKSRGIFKYTIGNDVDFKAFLDSMLKYSVLLNIKSERIEYKVLELLEKYNIKNYFFLDSSFPMIYNLSCKKNNKNIAIRYSEYEDIEKCKNLVDWIWIDCFTKYPVFSNIDSSLKKCIVSPELQGHNLEMMREVKKRGFAKVDSICTKIYNINKWRIIK